MRTITDADLAALKVIGEFAVSPDGTRVVFAVGTTDYEANKTYSSLWLVPVLGGTPRPLTTARAKDSSPRWSPDGTRIAFTSDRGEGKRALWIIPADGGEATAVRRPDGTPLHEDADITDPQWLPDGTRLMYASKTARPSSDDPTHAVTADSDVKVYTQLGYKFDGVGFWDGRYKHLFTVPATGGEPTQLTDGPWDDTQPAPSPDGTRIAFVSRRTPNREYNSISDIFTVLVDGGEAKQLTPGMGPVANPQWSPDGATLAFTGHDLPPATGPATNDMIWTIPATGGTPACLTRDYDREVGGGVGGDFAQGGVTPPVQWTPDGTGLLFMAGDRGTTALMHVPATGGAVTPVVADERNILGFSLQQGRLVFSVSTATLPSDLFTMTTVIDAQTIAHVVDVMQAKYGVNIGEQTVQDIAFATGNTSSVDTAARINVRGRDQSSGLPRMVSVALADVAEAFMTASTPREMHESRLTQVNADVLKDIKLSEPERIAVPVEAGVTMDGWLLHPPDFDPAKQYPLILDIHGGPRGQYGYTFMHAFQRYAAEGYVVAYFNPRGSTGYGQAFTSRLTGDWGGVDAHDVLAGLDYVLERRPYVSDSRVGLTGGSYGGYLTNWLLGTQPHRWRAAVTERSTISRLSSYGTSDVIWKSLEWEFGGPWWERRDFYWDRSPVAHVHEIVAPLLIIHSEQDHRCTISEAEQLFTALRRLGRDVVFVRFPDESHGLSRTGKPKHRRERLERLVGWWKKYLPADESQTAATNDTEGT